nr:helix-turn-helix transcriptional regulator [Luteimonas galliterrae]
MKINAELIKRLREERGWSQEHLAAVSGLSARTIQRLEADGKASHESRLALASAFGVEPSVLGAAQANVDPLTSKPANPASALQAWLEHPSWRWFFVMLAAWFIYQAGRAAGEAWYYIMH